jgi:methylglutaconyl-CoA hydratase
MPMKTLTIDRRAAGVAQVTMSRPEVFNAFDEAMIADVDAAFTELAADATVRVIVLAGAGKHFSAGADLQWMQRASQASEAWNLEDARRFATMLARIEACPKPTVARVQGAALGGGVGLVAACDVAVAADNASFAVSEAKFGILPAVIGPYVTNAVGKRQARRLALTTARIGAVEALAMGLVQQGVPQAGLDGAVEAVEVRELTAATIARVRGSDEAREGLAAFLAKRSPSWVPQA